MLQKATLPHPLEFLSLPAVRTHAARAAATKRSYHRCDLNHTLGGVRGLWVSSLACGLQLAPAAVNI